MTKKLEIYKCEICGNLVEVLFPGAGALSCCGQAMTLQVANKVDAATEKHLPVVKDLGDKIEVSVGSVPHPMEEKHYIVFIEVLTDKKVLRKELKPGEEPKAIFKVSMDKVKEVREYCNIHGLWKA